MNLETLSTGNTLVSQIAQIKAHKQDIERKQSNGVPLVLMYGSTRHKDNAIILAEDAMPIKTDAFIKLYLMQIDEELIKLENELKAL